MTLDRSVFLLGISAVVAAGAFNQVRASQPVAAQLHQDPEPNVAMTAGYFSNVGTSPLQGIDAAHARLLLGHDFPSLLEQLDGDSDDGERDGDRFAGDQQDHGEPSIDVVA